MASKYKKSIQFVIHVVKVLGIPDIDLKSIKSTDSPRSIKITKTANNFLFYQHPAIHYKLYLFYSKLKLDIKSTFYYKRSLGMFDNSYTCTIYMYSLLHWRFGFYAREYQYLGKSYIKKINSDL